MSGTKKLNSTDAVAFMEKLTALREKEREEMKELDARLCDQMEILESRLSYHLMHTERLTEQEARNLHKDVVALLQTQIRPLIHFFSSNDFDGEKTKQMLYYRCVVEQSAEELLVELERHINKQTQLDFK